MPLKAGVVQFCPVYGRVQENLENLSRWIAQAAEQGAELLVLPEMAWTGYLWKDADAVLPYCEEFGSGRGQDTLKSLAREWGIALAFGFPESHPPYLYNSQALVTPDGTFWGPYRKTHLFDFDYTWARPGNSGYLTWETVWGRTGAGICMDLNYPDLMSFHRKKQTEVFLFSTNWLDEGASVVPYWREKLSGFRGLSLFANRGGEEYGVRFRGQSSIFLGEQLVATLNHRENGLLLYDWERKPPVS